MQTRILQTVRRIVIVHHLTAYFYPQALHESRIVHYDLKLENVLVDRHPGTADHDFWAPQSSTPPFEVVVTDFGEAQISAPGERPINDR